MNDVLKVVLWIIVFVLVISLVFVGVLYLIKPDKAKELYKTISNWISGIMSRINKRFAKKA